MSKTHVERVTKKLMKVHMPTKILEIVADMIAFDNKDRIASYPLFLRLRDVNLSLTASIKHERIIGD